MQRGDAPGLTLTIVTPRGTAYTADCDSVILPLADDKDGAGGGSIGVRRGHVRAEMALQKGVVRALANGATINSVSIPGGFALVENDVVTVLAESADFSTFLPFRD